MTLDELKAAATAGEIDTVLLALTDMQGRLQGKRLTARHFLDTVVEPRRRGVQLPARRRRRHEHRRRLRDVQLGARLRRLRDDAPTSTRCARVPWQEGTAVCLADIVWDDGKPRRRVAAPDPARAARAAGRARLGGLRRHRARVHGLRGHLRAGVGQRLPRPRPRPTATTSTTRCSGTARVEPLLRRIRNAMMDAGMSVEDSKGECNFGQHEINFRYDTALRTADQHVIYKNGAKEIGRPGRQGDHLHGEVRRARGQLVPHPPLAARHRRRARSSPTTTSSSTASSPGMLAGLRELTLFLAPNVNSYKRYAARSFAPTTVAWGNDNRTCALRVVGHGPGKRIECRVPGRRRQPLPGPQRAHRRRPARRRRAARPRARAARATRTRRRSARRCPARCATPRDLFGASRAGPRRLRPRGRRRTTSTTPTSSSTPSTPRSPTGSASAASSACRSNGSGLADVDFRLRRDVGSFALRKGHQTFRP